MNIAEKMPISVLIVDDEPLIIEQMAQILSRRCTEVVTAMNGQEALEQFTSHSIDVIVSDIDMPVMNGIELLKAVRQLNPTLPFIITTGLKNLDILIDAIEYNVTSFIPKPVQKHDLIAKLMAISTEKTLAIDLKQNKNLLDQYKFIVDKALLVSKADRYGVITYVNDHFCTLSGYTREELIGKPHSIIRDPEMPRTIFKEMWETITAKKIWRGIIHNRTKEGERYTVKSTIAPILDVDGNIVEYMAIREDITAVIQKDKELEEEKQKLEQILNHVDNIVAMASIEEKLLFINKKFFDSFPFNTFEEFKAKHQCICDCFLNKEGYLQTMMGDEYWIHYILKRPYAVHKAIMMDKYSVEVIFSVSVQQVLNHQKELYVITLSDITQLEKAKEEAVAASKIKSDFLANMSHEIRTPMNGILGFAKLLENTELSEKQKKYLDIINGSTSSLLGIINDILDFSKLESGKFELDITSWNPFIEFEKTSSLFTAKMEEKSIAFDRIIEPDIPECIYADNLRLKQIISNLIGNAVKFTPEGGNIIFYAKRIKFNGDSQDLLRIGVRDTGIGIESYKLEHIFESFSQADTSTTRQYGGTGLGLSISSQLVSLMGGKLRVESTIGEGSHFYFDIPLQVSTESQPISHWFNGMQIGIYEDEEPHPSQKKVTDYLATLQIPFHVRHISELEGFLQPNTIHIFFCSIPEEVYEQIKSQGIKAIVIGAEFEKDFSSSSIDLVVDVEHNLSSLYNVLLKIAIENSTSSLKLEPSSGIKVRGNVLVAEDNEVNRMLIEELFQSLKISFDSVTNGKEAVERLQNHTYDLIFMDINMPVMGGVEALHLIKDTHINAPVIALTANAMEGDREKFLKDGFDDYLMKPIQMKELNTVLSRYLGSSEDAETESENGASEDSKIVNFDAIHNAFPLSEKVIVKLLKAYLDTCDDSLKKLSAAIDENNIEQIELISHMIKGSAANLQFEPLVSVAAQIEAASHKKEAIDYGSLLERILLLSTQIKHEIEELLDAKQA